MGRIEINVYTDQREKRPRNWLIDILRQECQTGQKFFILEGIAVETLKREKKTPGRNKGGKGKL